VLAHGHALARSLAARVGGHMAVVLEQRHGRVGGAQPQGLAHQRERRRVQHPLELHMAVAVHVHAVPGTQVWRLAR
jgi:hypothetical protein